MSHELEDKCGLFGYSGRGENDAAQVVRIGLSGVQHRGQEAAGMATTDGETIFAHRKSGLVDQVFYGVNWDDLPGSIAIGHTRYSTSGGKGHEQPVLPHFALAHNGTISNTAELDKFNKEKGRFNPDHNDTEKAHTAIDYYYTELKYPLAKAMQAAKPLLTGAYALLAMDKEGIVAMRDDVGIRPLIIGKKDENYVLASETCALDVIGAEYLRDVRPGEIVTVKEKRLRSVRTTDNEERPCVFEYIYLKRPDSRVDGEAIEEIRERIGRELAREDREKDKENPINIDVVIGVPDSGTPYAIGYADEAGLRYRRGIINGGKLPRSFIEEGAKRDPIIGEKLNVVTEVVKDKDVLVAEDSIVHGNSIRIMVRKLRKAGARSVHVRVGSPPIIYPDPYGINTPNQEELFAFNKTVKEMLEALGEDAPDSLRYVSNGGLENGIGKPLDELTTSCLTGIYPIKPSKEMQESIVYRNK